MAGAVTEKKREAGAEPCRMRLGTVMALIGGTCWGFSGCCGQFLFQQKGAQAPWLVSLRLFFAGLLLIAAGFCIHGKRNLEIFQKKRDALHLLAFSLCGITFCQFTYFMAIQASNAGTATVLQYLSPVMILFVVCIRERRRPKGLELAAIGLSVLGTFVLGTHGDIHTFHITGQALFWGLLAAVSSVIYTMLPGGLIIRYDIYQVLGFGMFFGGVAMSLAVRPWSYELVWDGGTWGALTGVIVVGTALAFALYLQGVSMIGPLRGSILASVEPISAVILSVLWLGTAFETADFLGFVLILSAVMVLTLAQQKRGKTTERPAD
ncbi:DMT family transporter [Lacrimispora sp. 210928-DFI.3.58]|nr:DMT family transporter [Lacrimispora sp. 210928-DFI.3.58]